MAETLDSSGSAFGELAAPRPVFSAGDLVSSRFEIVNLLGRGGMGEVYEVIDCELGDRVALKTIRPQAGINDAMVRRFKSEVRLARRVTHPNVSRLFDLGLHEDGLAAGADTVERAGGIRRVLFVTMELLEGVRLDQYLAQHGPLPPSEALPLVRQLCDALDAAHTAGVLHRDLKPANVMLVPGGPRGSKRVVVTDFGLALPLSTGASPAPGTEPEPGPSPASLELSGGSRAEAARTLDGPPPPGIPMLGSHLRGNVQGTPGYLAPEQIAGRAVTAAADVYALGIVIYEILSGSRPWTGDSDEEVLRRNIHEPPRPLRVVAPGIDPRWEAVVQRCLQADPEARFPSVRELWRAFAGEEETRRPRLLAIHGEGAAAIAQIVAPLLASETGIPILDVETTRTAAIEAAADGGAPERLLTLLSSRHGVNVLIELWSADGVGAVSGEMRLTARVHCTDNARAFEVAIEGRTEGIESIAHALVTRIVDEAGLPRVTSAPAEPRAPLLPRHPEAAQAYLAGLDARAALRTQEAMEWFDRALDLDPSFAPGHWALADALHSLGYETDAAQAAQRAFELSIDLPREERLWIEAKFRLLSRDRTAAVDIYRSLFVFRPEHVEYGLALVQALCLARRSDEALEVVGRLRALAAERDLRVDLAEARALDGKRDHAGSLVAADALAARAREIGAFTFVAAADSIAARALNGKGDPIRAGERAREAADLYSRSGNQAERARAILCQAQSLRAQGRPLEARARAEEALALAREVGSVQDVGAALTTIGGMLVHQSDLDGAATAFREAVSIQREAGDLANLSAALRGLGSVGRLQGSYDTALRLFEESAAVARAEGDPNALAATLANLANVAMEAGEMETAQATAEELRAILPSVTSSGTIPMLHYVVAGICGQSGDVRGAVREYTAALEMRREIGGEVFIDLTGIAWGKLQLCDLAGARQAAEEALADLRARNRPRDEATVCLYLGETLAAAGQPDLAETTLQRAESLARAGGDTWTLLVARTSLANFLLNENRVDEAEALVVELLPEAAAQGRRVSEASARLLHARVHALRGRFEAAEDMVTRAKMLLAEEKYRNRHDLLHVTITQGRVLTLTGHLAAARQNFHEAVRAARELGLVLLELECTLLLGQVEVALGESEEGSQRLREVAREAELRGAGRIAALAQPGA